MAERSPANVLAAIEMLLEELDTELDWHGEANASAMARRDFTSARQALARAERAATFREKVTALQQEWEQQPPPPPGRVVEPKTPPTSPAAVPRRNLGRAGRGRRTPEEAYYEPILTALAELGGRARVEDVLARVEQKMRGAFNDVDREAVPSTGEARWRNAARWARSTLVKQGLLKSGSPYGVWELSDAGRARIGRTR